MEIETLGKTALFRSMTEEEIHLCLKELRSQEKKFKKGTVIMHAGSLTDRMGLVLSGSVTIESNDVWGNCTILSHVGSGQFFCVQTKTATSCSLPSAACLSREFHPF